MKVLDEKKEQEELVIHDYIERGFTVDWKRAAELEKKIMKKVAEDKNEKR